VISGLWISLTKLRAVNNLPCCAIGRQIGGSRARSNQPSFTPKSERRNCCVQHRRPSCRGCSFKTTTYAYIASSSASAWHAPRRARALMTGTNSAAATPICSSGKTESSLVTMKNPRCNRTWPAPSSCSPTSSAESNFECGSGLSVGPGLSLKPGGAEQRSAAFLRRRPPGGRDRFPQARNLQAGSRLILQA